MSISYRILGKPGKDNGLFLRINSGTKLYRLLFDCGENILQDLDQHEIKSIDYLFFSHLHVDHIAGFDYFFRRNYDRTKKPVIIYGPEGTSQIIHNRLLGFTWNLLPESGSTWNVNDISENEINTYYFSSSEGFAERHFYKKTPINSLILETEDIFIKTALLDHRIDSAGFYVKEKSSINIDKTRLIESGLTAGAWLENVRNSNSLHDEQIIIHDKIYSIKKLQRELLVKTEGDSVAYLTDFIFSEKNLQKVKKLISGCGTMICESQYLKIDKELAEKNFHLTTEQAAFIAKESEVKKFVLFHVSDRYRIKDLGKMLSEAKEVFSKSEFPQEWNLE